VLKNLKNHKDMILLSITLPFKRRGSGQYHALLIIFAVYDSLLLTTLWLNYSFQKY